MRKITKEEKKEYDRLYHLRNKEKRNLQTKSNYNKDKSKFYFVYYIKEYDYIGITRNLVMRSSQHRTVNNRIFKELAICGVFTDKRQALSREAELHEIGFKGLNPTMFKNK